MRFRNLTLMILCAAITAAALTPAFADDDGWRRHEWHERGEWRGREWREHEWREHHYPPPYVAAPPYGYYVAPPAYYPNPGYYR